MPITRLTTGVENLYALESVIPEHLRDNGMFIDFLEAYFEWLQEDPNSPNTIINRLNELRDIDRIEEMFIRFLQYEYAVTIPTISGGDKRKLYKQVNDIYRSKGSTPAYESLFNLLFNEKIELYFPRIDVLRLSDGKWDDESNRYVSNDGFLSDTKYIQDSFFYQDYSYVIKTGQNVSKWRDVVKKLLHPSGFAFFGQINIFSRPLVELIKAPLVQIGTSTGDVVDYPIIIGVVRAPSANKVFYSITKTIIPIARVPSPNGPSYSWLDKIKFTLPDSLSDYGDLQIVQASNKERTNVMPGSEITIS
jgi:hypothetical protein